MKIYITGKITGYDLEFARKKFEESERYLKRSGYGVVNPMKLHKYVTEKRWEQYMIKDIWALFGCDAIYMHDDWKLSIGARIEHNIAVERNMAIMYG